MTPVTANFFRRRALPFAARPAHCIRRIIPVMSIKPNSMLAIERRSSTPCTPRSSSSVFDERRLETVRRNPRVAVRRTVRRPRRERRRDRHAGEHFVNLRLHRTHQSRVDVRAVTRHDARHYLAVDAAVAAHAHELALACGRVLIGHQPDVQLGRCDRRNDVSPVRSREYGRRDRVPQNRVSVRIAEDERAPARRRQHGLRVREPAATLSRFQRRLRLEQAIDGREKMSGCLPRRGARHSARQSRNRIVRARNRAVRGGPVRHAPQPYARCSATPIANHFTTPFSTFVPSPSVIRNSTSFKKSACRCVKITAPVPSASSSEFATTTMSRVRCTPARLSASIVALDSLLRQKCLQPLRRSEFVARRIPRVDLMNARGSGGRDWRQVAHPTLR